MWGLRDLGLRCEANGNCSLPGFYAASSGHYYRCFRITYFLTLEVGTDVLSRNCYNKLSQLARNNPEERSSQNVANFINLTADQLLQGNTSI
jgi:hypothetical protein